MKNYVLILSLVSLTGVFALLAACSGDGGAADATKTVATGAAGNGLTATISNATGNLKKGQQTFTLTFTDSAGKKVDVGSVGLNYQMAAMGTMSEMNSGATFKTTGTPGVYTGSADIEMVGEWKAQVTYEGPAGKGSFSLPVIAK